MQLPSIIKQACSRLKDIDTQLTDTDARLKRTQKKKMATLERHRELGGKIASINSLHTKRKKAKRKLSANETELNLLHQLRDQGTSSRALDVTITSKEDKIEEQKRKLALVKDELSLEDANSTMEQHHKTIVELEVHSKQEGDIESERAELQREREHCYLLISKYDAMTQVKQGRMLILVLLPSRLLPLAGRATNTR